MNARLNLLTVFGLGHLRPASGTWGSLPPPAIAFAMASLAAAPRLIDGVLVALLLVFSFACIRFGAYGERTFRGKDPRQIVADEVAGQSIALLALPWREPGEWIFNGMLAATAFFSFRIFDIIKPPPANGLQRLHGGVGVLVDDLVAGVYALIITQLLVRMVYVDLFADLI